MIMVLSLWNSYSIPVDIAFEPEIFEALGNRIVNHIVDALFAIDMVLNFVTSIVDEATGQEILSPKKIMIHYMKSRFVIDLLATIPFDTIFDGLVDKTVSGKLSLFSLLKLFRVLRLTKIISYINASENIKHSLKIFKLIFFLVTYIHCQACLWFYYTNFDKSWFPLEKILLNQMYFYDDHVSVLYQYCFSVYHSVNILLGEEMLPVTSL
jgi:hypothetical protein